MKKYLIIFKTHPDRPLILDAKNRDEAIFNAMICACVPETEIVSVTVIR
jgi:hypothetical protein